MKKFFILVMAFSFTGDKIGGLLYGQEKLARFSHTTTHRVGESFGGGIVFFVYRGGEHGLIAATADQDKGLRWFGGINVVTGDGVGSGAKNTSIVLGYKGAPPDVTFAAKLCDEYSVKMDGKVYNDWYLPSKLELSLLYIRRNLVGGFSYNYYWSSTIHQGDVTWFQDFGNGRQDVNISMPNSVRAIRSF
jgi:hypothetical protein